MRPTFLGLCLLIASGCTVSCPEGMILDDADRCVPDVPPQDGGIDGGIDSGEDGGFDGSSDAGPCGMECGGDTPYCDEARGECVECTTASAIDDCTEPDAPACVDGACAGCTGDTQCMDRAATPSCDEASGRCVACTPDSETTDCGTRACDPVAFTCTTNDRGTVDTCEPCLADSECIDGNRCIPLTYDGADRGFYCMPEAVGGCLDRPWTVPMTDRASRSGEAAANYCGINEALTTCEAVLAALEGQGAGCVDDSACPEGGRCEPVSAVATPRCTYSCGNELQCPSVIQDPAIATCNTGGDRYCGRTP